MKTQIIIGCLWIQTKLTFSQNQHLGPAAYMKKELPSSTLSPSIHRNQIQNIQFKTIFCV